MGRRIDGMVARSAVSDSCLFRRLCLPPVGLDLDLDPGPGPGLGPGLHLM